MNNGFRQRGFSLPELLVAMGLGVTLLLAAAQIHTSLLGSVQQTIAEARVNNDARVARALLTEAIRSAGFPGCHPRLQQNLTVDDWQPGVPAVGVDAGDGVVGPRERLVVRRMRSIGMFRVVHQDPVQGALTLDRPHGLESGMPVVVAGRGGAVCLVFRQAVDDPRVLYPGPGPRQFNRPRDAYPALTGPVEVFRPQRRVFFLAESVGQSDQKSLYRRRSDRGNRREALVEGIDDLTLAYGIDETGDGAADGYHPGFQSTSPVSVVAVDLGIRQALPIPGEATDGGHRQWRTTVSVAGRR
ncbi:PilW family protein [Spiribacter sp. 218]|uniref:PilW family protein n=1 Tax=Spiribacter pallidus TaxID=1987936 RepID=UPI00349F178D